MKIIALLPVKNEAWALPSYLSSVHRVADQMIALDDGSTDASAELLRRAGADVHRYDASKEAIVHMSTRRQRLLELGRAALGTHFIWLDADETFSANFLTRARDTIVALQPGQKLTMRWIHAWKDTEHYLADTRSPFGDTWKDFIIADDGSDFSDRFLSEARTPGACDSPVRLPESAGGVLHWQFARWEITQYKQALYRCLELLEGSRGARRINHMYRITLDVPDLAVRAIPNHWTDGLAIPRVTKSDQSNPYRAQLMALFADHGIEHFEPLQIWHIKELREHFIATCGYAPRSKTYPAILTALNKIRRTWLRS